jgi:hypothetical protein
MPLSTAGSSELAKKPSPCAAVTGPWLIKLAKHMALLGCLMIAGTATGRTAVSRLTIFLLIVGAVLAHLWGRVLERRAATSVRLRSPGP